MIGKEEDKDVEASIEKAQNDAHMFYNRAKTVFPHEGKIYHQLATLSSSDNDYLSAVYCAMWALSCSYPSTNS